jgi:hypothetical protein
MARMPNRHVYLHETIAIAGTGSEAYKAHTGTLGTDRRDDGAPLVGTWQQSGSTGAWPVVVNLWEMRDWDHWAEILARQYTRSSAQDPALKQWWTEATQWRSGGFDRILVPAPFSPTRREIVARRVQGAACLQEIATVKPGAAERYLAAVGSRRRRVMERSGITLLGAYRTAMRETEVLLLWNVPTFEQFTRYVHDADGTAGRAWRQAARVWRVDYRETLLVPSPWCVHHPDWRGNA